MYCVCMYSRCLLFDYAPLPMQCYNKVDTVSIEEVDRLARTPNSIVISCGLKLNLDYLLYQIWEYLQLIRVYTKRRGGVV